MKTSENCFDRERLEVLYSPEESKPAKPTKTKGFSVLNSIWQNLVTFFTKEPEVQVTKRCDRFGNTWWEAYDPFSGKSVSFGGEIEMLDWIEKRHFRSDNSMF
jgi:hypothetical protein